ncbi:septation regulator SpoVG [Candidatus Mcinerneyibacteriota bacterium]|nr:septation regulator SpoVG [Candidatus Mcinerneyibacteriota bacterium]
MQVTDVKIYLRENDKLKAFATITLDDCFVIRGLKIIEGNKGRFVAMPSMRKKDGTFQDIAHPINNETRMMIEEMVFNAYEEALASGEQTTDETDEAHEEME